MPETSTLPEMAAAVIRESLRDASRIGSLLNEPDLDKMKASALVEIAKELRMIRGNLASLAEILSR